MGLRNVSRTTRKDQPTASVSAAVRVFEMIGIQIYRDYGGKRDRKILFTAVFVSRNEHAVATETEVRDLTFDARQLDTTVFMSIGSKAKRSVRFDFSSTKLR
jgi:hypothetical protein